MIIGILSRQPRSYSTRRLKEAAVQRGHSVQVCDTLRFAMTLEKERPGLYYGTRRLPHFDAIIPRIGSSITFFGLAVLRQFEQMGVYTPNESVAIARSRDKLRAIQTLSRYDIGIPPTVFVRDSGDILHAIRRLGGPPVIVKVLQGTQGVGVILAETAKMAETIVQTLHSAKQNVLIQKFVKESKGRDIRAFVVGDRVVAAMRRTAPAGEFRSNIHRGGRAQAVHLSAEYESTAIKAAQIIGLRMAGVDILESDEGPQVMEVNSSPGLEGIEKVSGVDVASIIIQDIEQQVLFPDVDLKQRLRLAGGYGVVEFPVHNLEELEGKTLRETNLAQRQITVISITRPGAVIPNPHGDEVIRKGDILLCYGNLHELRAMMPRKSRRKRIRKRSE